ncbi:hypothetical protein BDF20DRAFT_866298 [Mycotypha africana]|uniref:uncharacterized protein n=1 Tax=Mycotypha africana TaxID=64632 RepID=UPI002301761F|nr:uncharacterized protein BDF20DRAFT_866298 [Mycotypha africana]KAI8982331.1 hypothetical protein BDF20DRAFT_866298 [Mycotypha africana]
MTRPISMTARVTKRSPLSGYKENNTPAIPKMKVKPYILHNNHYSTTAATTTSTSPLSSASSSYSSSFSSSCNSNNSHLIGTTAIPTSNPAQPQQKLFTQSFCFKHKRYYSVSWCPSCSFDI